MQRMALLRSKISAVSESGDLRAMPAAGIETGRSGRTYLRAPRVLMVAFSAGAEY